MIQHFLQQEAQRIVDRRGASLAIPPLWPKYIAIVFGRKRKLDIKHLTGHRSKKCNISHSYLFTVDNTQSELMKVNIWLG
jgi:hypothetical protein